MANSSDVVAGADAKASDYNNLRKDVIDVPTGHSHNGEDSSLLGDGCSFKNNQTRYLSIPPCGFIPRDGDTSYELGAAYVKCGALGTARLYCPVNLPHGATILKVTAYWYRDDALAEGQLEFTRWSLPSVSGNIIGTAHSNSDAGYHTVVDSTIFEPLVDNEYFCLFFHLSLIPNNNVEDVHFRGVVIEYTINQIG